MTASNEKSPRLSGKASRREVLGLTGAGVVLALGGSLCLSAECKNKEKEKGKDKKKEKGKDKNEMLQPGDKIDIGGKGKEIVEKAYRLGFDYEKKYGGCAQCTLAALQDAIPFVEVDKDLFRGAGCLDGGATPKGIQNCGGFTGSGMVIGYLCGRTRDEKFYGSTKPSHRIIRKVYKRFEEHYGSVLCKDVRKGAKSNCPEVVGRAAKWTAEAILAEFTDYEPPPETPDDKKPPKKPADKKPPKKLDDKKPPAKPAQKKPAKAADDKKTPDKT